MTKSWETEREGREGIIVEKRERGGAVVGLMQGGDRGRSIAGDRREQEQGESTEAGAWQEGGEADRGTEIVGHMVNRASRLIGQPGQLVVPAESRTDLSAHGFWKRGTTVIFDILFVNLNTGSYLRMTPEKSLAKAEKEKKDMYLRACLYHSPDL